MEHACWKGPPKAHGQPPLLLQCGPKKPWSLLYILLPCETVWTSTILLMRLFFHSHCSLLVPISPGRGDCGWVVWPCYPHFMVFSPKIKFNVFSNQISFFLGTWYKDKFQRWRNQVDRLLAVGALTWGLGFGGFQTLVSACALCLPTNEVWVFCAGPRIKV